MYQRTMLDERCGEGRSEDKRLISSEHHGDHLLPDPGQTSDYLHVYLVKTCDHVPASVGSLPRILGDRHSRS